MQLVPFVILPFVLTAIIEVPNALSLCFFHGPLDEMQWDFDYLNTQSNLTSLHTSVFEAQFCDDSCCTKCGEILVEMFLKFSPVSPCCHRQIIVLIITVYDEPCDIDCRLTCQIKSLKHTAWLALHPVMFCVMCRVHADVGYTRVYPQVSGLAAWNENCKWYSSLPLGAVVSLFCESV
jgi:hypothetical protein